MENLHLLQTGRGTYFDRNINILSWTDDSKVIVGRYSSIARDCTFLLNANHRPDWVTTATTLLGPVSPELDEYLNHTLGHNSSRGDIIIGNDVWIGTKSIIMSGVRIGDGAVIAAGSVVSKDVKPYTVVGGNPAQLLYTRFSSEVVEKLMQIKWWDWSDRRIKELSKFMWSDDIMAFIARAMYDMQEVKKVEILSVEDSRRVYFQNVTSKPLNCEVRFQNHDSSLIYAEPMILVPDIIYFSEQFDSSEDRRFMILDLETSEILNETEVQKKVKDENTSVLEDGKVENQQESTLRENS